MIKLNKILNLVTPALQEPLPGWVDNMNGPTGVMIGAGKGVIRSMICNGDLKSEVIPVDLAVNGLLLLPYHFYSIKQKPKNIPVYNLTIDESKKRTWKWIMDVGRDFGLQYPFEIGLWYPDGGMTMNKIYHQFCVIMFMWLPAYLVDFLLMIFRQKRFMVRVQTKISVGLEMLQFFTTRAWDFKSNNFAQIYHILNSSDQKMFKINTDDVDDLEYMRLSILGGRQYVVKESLSSLPRARAQLKVMYYLDRVCKAIISMGLLYWICLKLNITNWLHSNLAWDAIEIMKN